MERRREGDAREEPLVGEGRDAEEAVVEGDRAQGLEPLHRDEGAEAQGLGLGLERRSRAERGRAGDLPGPSRRTRLILDNDSSDDDTEDIEDGSDDEAGVAQNNNPRRTNAETLPPITRNIVRRFSVRLIVVSFS